MSLILVTGGTGFIGSCLADKLHRLGHEVAIMGSPSEQKCNHHHFVNTLSDLRSLGKIDVCFHQAANNDTTDGDRESMFRSNCKWSLDVFGLVRLLGCRKIIYASSASVYGKLEPPYREDMETSPLSPYSMSKDILEMLAGDFGEFFGVQTIGLRYFNVYGARESHKGKRASMVYQMCRKATDGETLKLFKWGEQSRDWVSVDDVVDANVKCLDYEKSDVFNIGSGVSTSMNDIVKGIKEATGKDIGVEYIDNPYESAYQPFTLACMDKARREMGFIPKVGINEGISRMAEEMKKAPSF